MKKIIDYLLKMRTRNVLLILIGSGLITGSASLLMSLIKGPADFYAWIESGLLNFSTGIFQAFLIYILLEIVIGRREKKEAEKRAGILRVEEEARRRVEQQITVITELKASISREAQQNVLDKMKKLELFRGINLYDIKLPGADLQSVDLEGADLRKANLIDANLQGANLTYADLQEAVMIRANLQGTNLEYANLKEAELSEATLHEARLLKANLQRAILYRARLTRADLQEANLQGTNLSEANLHQSIFRKANLQWADFTGARLFEADLREADLTEARFNSYTTLPDGTQWIPGTDL